MDRVDAIVAGAGAVGLAVGRALAGAGLETLILEREGQIGAGVSSRNSEVVHAGIYYPSSSLKAALCVKGRHQLYDYLTDRRLPHRRCGKLIVASDESEAATLDALLARARSNGVYDLERLARDEARALEPELECAAALYSPSTGVFDSHAYMLSLAGDFEAAGGVIALRTPVEAIVPQADGLSVAAGGAAPMRLACRYFINCAGIDAPALAARIADLAPAHRPSGYFAKGNYFSLAGRAPFSRLVYPAPEPGGLGVHFTLDMCGQGRFGPDVEWVETPAFEIDPARGKRFYAAVRKYWPGLKDGALRPDYAGIRPKITPPGAPAGDFLIAGSDRHGIAGLINLFGIESPGLTASLAIAERVRGLCLKQFQHRGDD